MPEPSRRLFFALWPDADTAQAIWRGTAGWLPKGAGRRLSAGDLHITLAFLGAVDATVQTCMTGAAETVEAAGFTLTLDEPGHFPKPQVVWLGTSNAPPGLLQLQSKLVGQLTNLCDFRPEARPFVPHMTLWRKVKHCELPPNMPPIVWNVQRFVLACSETLPTGAKYSIVREWPLAATA